MKKWCEYFSNAGHDISVVTFDLEDMEGVENHHLLQSARLGSGDLGKLRYLSCGGQLRKIVDEIDPDILHVHYASSYGALAALSLNRPYILSVWGSDIFDFPRKSPLHALLMRLSLCRASFLMSTSRAMAEEASSYTSKTFDITPFGVDTDKFNPSLRARTDSKFIVGTIKSLSWQYGIETLLDACAVIRRERGDIPLEVRIAGKGPDEDALKGKARTLGLSDCIVWLGYIGEEDVRREWANMDVALIPSEQESFGVAAVEAQACGIPVIVSDVPGLMEATCPGKSSIVVKRGDFEAIAQAVIGLHDNAVKRSEMGTAGRSFVAATYDLYSCFNHIESAYERFLQRLH